MTKDGPDWIRWRRRRRAILLSLAISFLGVSCVSLPRPPLSAPHAWSSSRGPVVPHDSFPADCSLCHESGSWNRLRADFQFDHGRQTGVPLEGAHASAECLRCHNDRGPVAAFASRGCAGCHEDIHRGQLGQRCEQCHQQENWIPQGQVMLHNRTRFPLAGAHTAVACFRCHPGAQVGNFSRAPVQCEACHAGDARRAQSPDHVAQGWTANCQECHRPIAWRGSGFDHSRFPLTGGHSGLACAACHHQGVFQGLSRDCASCHLADFQATQNPHHPTAGFSTDCASCHTTVSWQGAPFNHANISANCVQCHLPDYQGTTSPNHAASGIPTSCEACHRTSTWTPVMFNHQGITSNCVNCHLPQYQATTNPNHVAAGYPQTCQACHGTNSWIPATFNHQGITSNCVQCHLPDYQATTNPNHVAAGFPTSCESCHNTTSWLGATFDHPFNIRSGPHRNYSCSECHRTPSSYQIVSCIHCHAHSQSQMADKHSGVSGYVWNSNSCVACHPTGR